MKFSAAFLFALLVLKCGSADTPNSKIKTGMPGDKATWGDTLNLSLSKTEGVKDVAFFLNDNPIASTHALTDEKMGVHRLMAKVTLEDKTFEITSTLTLFAPEAPQLYSYEVLNTYPHDITAYTQGLEFDGDLLYESTGLNGQSSLRVVDFKTGEPIENKPLDDAYFGEGLTLVKDKVIQLTWKAMQGFVYDKASLTMLKSFPYTESKEGWGLCNDGTQLYKSDGTEKIWMLDSETYSEQGNIQVMTNKAAIKNINELEWVEGKIFANTYQFDREVAVIIDPTSGIVEGVIDFSGLKKQVKQHADLNVLNGIAYHPERKTLFVTGKNWDTLFEVKILPKK